MVLMLVLPAFNWFYVLFHLKPFSHSIATLFLKYLMLKIVFLFLFWSLSPFCFLSSYYNCVYSCILITIQWMQYQHIFLHRCYLFRSVRMLANSLEMRLSELLVKSVCASILRITTAFSLNRIPFYSTMMIKQNHLYTVGNECNICI